MTDPAKPDTSSGDTPTEADAGEAKTEAWREVFGARVWVNDRGDLRVHAEINPPPLRSKTDE